MSNLQLKKELNRSGWIRKGGLWSKKGTDISGLTLEQARKAAGIKTEAEKEAEKKADEKKAADEKKKREAEEADAEKDRIKT